MSLTQGVPPGMNPRGGHGAAPALQPCCASQAGPRGSSLPLFSWHYFPGSSPSRGMLPALVSRVAASRPAVLGGGVRAWGRIVLQEIYRRAAFSPASRQLPDLPGSA